MLHRSLEESLRKAKQAFKEVNSENIIELCEMYLLLLNEFRNELYKFHGTPEISLQQPNPSRRESVLVKRREINLAITHTILELN